MQNLFPRFRLSLLVFATSTALAVTCAAQVVPSPQVAPGTQVAPGVPGGQVASPPVRNPTPVPTPPNSKGAAKVVTAEQAVEAALLLYGFPGGRAMLDQIRKTTFEKGTTRIASADGKFENANYQRFIIRGPSLDKEKIRLEQEFPTATYALVYSDGKIFGVYNNTVFTPRDDAAKSFENQIVRGLEALLRYKENESKIELASREKILGVEYFVVDVIDKQERKTRFYISAKSYRVMMLDYDDNGVKYRRRFYDYNYAQGTLVPFKTVLSADGKVVEESEVDTITFGQKVEENLFTGSLS